MVRTAKRCYNKSILSAEYMEENMRIFGNADDLPQEIEEKVSNLINKI